MSIALTADPVDLTSFTIVNSSAGINGYASGARFVYLGNSLDEGEQFTVTSGAFSQIFSISYAADAGKDVLLVAVPEPGAPASLIGGMEITDWASVDSAGGKVPPLAARNHTPDEGRILACHRKPVK
jgi:hypothetical protein